MIRDVNFYKFLKDAIVNKYRNANALDFRTIEYDPWIYKWARDTFRELKTPEFLNIQNRDVLERLYERLHIDPRLKPLDDPDLALGNKDYQLSESFHQQHEADRLLAQQKITAAAGPAPGSESATTMAGRGGPSTPSSHPPVIHNIPQISPTGISPNLPRPPIPEEDPATAKMRRLNEAKAIQEKGAATAKMESLQTAAKPELKFKPGFGNSLRNFGSRAGTFFQRNVGKYLTVGRAATGIGAVIGGFAGAGLTGGSSVGVLGGAVGGGILPSWFKSGGGGRFFGNLGNGAINAFSRLSNQVSRPSLSFAKGRSVWVIGGAFLLLMGAGLLIGGLMGGGTPSGETGNVGVGTATPSAGIQPIPAVHPTAPTADPSGLKQKIIDQFGITMNGYDDNHLKWAWEKLWDVSNTSFINFVRGSVITVDADSRQVGCPGAAVAVYLKQFPETLFKYGLTHELGHVIRNCPSTSSSFWSDHMHAFNQEEGVTYYAKHAAICTGSDNASEDYAEMIALYLNPSANIQMTACTPADTKYTNLRTKFPLHYNVARSVLGDY